MAIDKLWNLSFSCAPQAIDCLETYLEERALSVTTLAPPRQETARIEALFDTSPEDQKIVDALTRLAAENGFSLADLTLSVIEDLDWLKKVATDFPPLPIARWIIYGAAHKEAVQGEKSAIQIDATSAFGTGEHPTTKGCLLLLDQYLNQKTPASMLDIGCGSGILAMCYAQATGGRAVAVDLDPDSVQIAKENVRLNGLSDKVIVDISNGYAAPVVKENEPYDLIMSNIFADPLCELAPDLRHHLAPNGHAILSGILTHQAPKVIDAHVAQGLDLVEHHRLGEWSILAFTMK